MALYHAIQRVLLVGARTPQVAAAPTPVPPPRIAKLAAAFAAAHHRFDIEATKFGNRYRSGFWLIYLLSAVAVLCAVLPLAVGWDSVNRADGHQVSALCASIEVVIIAIVGAVYWFGHRYDWQGRWLQARTSAELVTYLPVIAPLLDLNAPDADSSWYARLGAGVSVGSEVSEIAALCASHQPEACRILSGAWEDPDFVRVYLQWVIDVLKGQQAYHRRLSGRQHVLMHRIHTVTGSLFGLTAVCALLHLIVHSVWLSLVTTFFPALAAGLHGALAQSEAYRLEAGSIRVATALELPVTQLSQELSGDLGAISRPRITATIKAAIDLIMDEHQDWHMLVRPHHLPLG